MPDPLAIPQETQTARKVPGEPAGHWYAANNTYFIAGGARAGGANYGTGGGGNLLAGGSKADGANLGTEGGSDLVARGSKADGANCGAGGGGGMGGR